MKKKYDDIMIFIFNNFGKLNEEIFVFNDKLIENNYIIKTIINEMKRENNDIKNEIQNSELNIKEHILDTMKGNDRLIKQIDERIKKNRNREFYLNSLLEYWEVEEKLSKNY